MLCLSHKYNRDEYVSQREEVWDFLNAKLDLKTLGKKTDIHIQVKGDIVGTTLMFKANDWLNEMTRLFNRTQYDLVEMVLSNKLHRENTDESYKIYFLINFQYHLTNTISQIYSFWNIVAQFFNVLYRKPLFNFVQRNWEKEEEKINCKLFTKLKPKNNIMRQIYAIYRDSLNKEILGLRHQVVHRRRIPIRGLGKEYYTKITPNVIELFAEFKSKDPDDLENKIIGLMIKIEDVIVRCFELWEEEINKRGYTNFTITRQ